MYRIFSVESDYNASAALIGLQKNLEEQGYELIFHQSQAEVLDEIKENQPDLILLDPTLPEQDGFRVCEKLKSDPVTENIPVIFVHTGSNPNGTLLKSFDSGATDFICIESGEIEVMARLKAAIRDKQAA